MKAMSVVLLFVLCVAIGTAQGPPILLNIFLDEFVKDREPLLASVTLRCVRILGKEGHLGGAPDLPPITKRGSLANLLEQLQSREKRSPDNIERHLMIVKFCDEFIFGRDMPEIPEVQR